MGADGILIINKPEGWTSFGLVARLKRLTGEKRVGHAGTLDPIATGVLPVCFGQATRVAEFIAAEAKVYLAEVKLGAATDTFDREGSIVYQGDLAGISADSIRQALASFCGTVEQTPPAYSALKKSGKPYYQLARQGLSVNPKPRRVTIHNISLVKYESPLVTLEVECSKGTYIRSLAHDLGRRLGCGAYLNNLTRLRCGPFFIEDAVTLSQFESACREATWRELLHPIDAPLMDWKAVVLSGQSELAVRHGSPLLLPVGAVADENKYCRAYSSDGHLVAVLRFVADKGYWHPFKVFSPPQESADF